MYDRSEEVERQSRKNKPLCTGCLDYFPDALLAVAELSRIGNEQHNPGEPLHWAKEKSTDEPDALIRHLIDRGTLDTDGVRHSAKVAWRALALLQREIDAERATVEKPDDLRVEVHLDRGEFAAQQWYPSAIRGLDAGQALRHAESLRRERGCAVRVMRGDKLVALALPGDPTLADLGDG